MDRVARFGARLRLLVFPLACAALLAAEAACSHHDPDAASSGDPRRTAIALCLGAAPPSRCAAIEPVLARVERNEALGKRTPDHRERWYEQHADERLAVVYLCDADRAIADCDNALLADAAWYGANDAVRRRKLSDCDRTYRPDALARDTYGCVDAVLGAARWFVKHKPERVAELQACAAVSSGKTPPGRETCLAVRVAADLTRGRSS
jgi:hypothetical protein